MVVVGGIIMIAVKEILEKQWSDFRQFVKDFAMKDSNTNDEEYNYGRYQIINSWNFSLFDPEVEYYCTCNNLQLKDIPGGIDSILK